MTYVRVPLKGIFSYVYEYWKAAPPFYPLVYFYLVLEKASDKADACSKKEIIGHLSNSSERQDNRFPALLFVTEQRR